MNSITRYRGDTAPDQFKVEKDNAASDITGCTFKMSVNSAKDPTDTSTQLYSLTGTITSALVGEVEFAPNPTQSDQPPGDYFYDVQMTDVSGAIRTLDKGRYRYIQDITKS